MRIPADIGMLHVNISNFTKERAIKLDHVPNQGSYYRNAKSAAVLVNPLTVQAVEVLHVQLHF